MMFSQLIHFNSNVTKEEWEHFSMKFITRAAQEVNKARQLRSYIDMLLKQVTEDLWKQFSVTNEAFRQRIAETREAKLKLENEHHEVIQILHYENQQNIYPSSIKSGVIQSNSNKNNFILYLILPDIAASK